MDQQLLSDLCTICHTEKPKYRCPRCKAQTCSLQCYKRHQQRASCNGKRDPAAYVKKSQWATPTGIDRDYNYLKGVERTVHDAHQNVSHRGIGPDHSKSKVTLRAWQPDSSLQRYLNDGRITVEHAPKGMSRQKDNHTRTTKSGNVVWTVEWAGTNSRTIQHDCPASQSLLELYTLFEVQARNAEKRRLNVNRPEQSKRGSKRRRKHANENPLHLEEEYLERVKAEEQPQLDDAKGPILDHSMVGDHASSDLFDQSLDDLARGHEQFDGTASPREPLLDNIDETAASRSSVVKQAIPSNGSLSTTPSIKSESYFYLLRPSTKGDSRVLIPLDLQASLTTALRDQTVQEYPTIYVLGNPPNDLPSGFLLEAEYLEKSRRTSEFTAGFDVKKHSSSADIGSSGNRSSQHLKQVDASSILEMLRRDITH